MTINYTTQTNVFENFKINFFAQYASSPELVKSAIAAESNQVSEYNLGNNPYTHDCELKSIKAQMTEKDLYVLNLYYEYLNSHDFDDNMLFGYMHL